MKMKCIIITVFVALLCASFLGCTNQNDMSKKKNNTSEEQPISPQSTGTSAPTQQVNPMALPPDTLPKMPIDKTRTIPIGTPISKEEMEKLKKESSQPDKKNPKKKPNQKAPDNNP